MSVSWTLRKPGVWEACVSLVKSSQGMACQIMSLLVTIDLSNQSFCIVTLDITQYNYVIFTKEHSSACITYCLLQPYILNVSFLLQNRMLFCDTLPSHVHSLAFLAILLNQSFISNLFPQQQPMYCPFLLSPINDSSRLLSL